MLTCEYMKRKRRPVFFFILLLFLLCGSAPAFATPVGDLLLEIRKARQEARYQDARDLIDRALPLAEPGSREMAKVLRARGMNSIDRGHSAGSLKDLQDALAIFEKIDGADSDFAAGLTNDIAVAQYGMGHLAEALPMYQKALTIREKLFGENHTDVAQTLNNLAWCHSQLGNRAAAESEFRRAIAILRKVEPEGRSLASYLFGLGYLLQSQQKYEEALPILEEAAQRADKTFSKDHPEAKRYRQILESVKRSLARRTKSKSST